MPADNSSTSEPRPWVTFGDCSSPDEDFLIGNREGLELLQRKIDEALGQGTCFIEEAGVEFNGVRVVEHDSRDGHHARRGRFADTLALFGCGLFVFFIGGVFVVGLKQVWSWLRW
ncbi:MAG: hypothetical protein H7A46_00310 [Verrucomicrobiales bacterium]|nr:hypothetical protein [Verrucomicrobiales bacterium]